MYDTLHVLDKFGRSIEASWGCVGRDRVVGDGYFEREDDAAVIMLDSLRHCQRVMEDFGGTCGGLRLGHGQKEQVETVG